MLPDILNRQPWYRYVTVNTTITSLAHAAKEFHRSGSFDRHPGHLDRYIFLVAAVLTALGIFKLLLLLLIFLLGWFRLRLRFPGGLLIVEKS